MIDLTPLAAIAARRKSLREAVRVVRATHAVDPAEAQCFIERLAIGNTALARMYFEEAQIQLSCPRVITLEPSAKLGS